MMPMESLAYYFAFGLLCGISRMNILGISSSVVQLAVPVAKRAEMSAGRKLNKVRTSGNVID